MGIILIRISVRITRKLGSSLLILNQLWLVDFFHKLIAYNPYLPKEETATMEFDLFKDDTCPSKHVIRPDLD